MSASTSSFHHYRLSDNNANNIPPPKIRRPPNAFILFRSEVLQKIKAEQAQQAKESGRPETKQQVLSKVAGEAWRLLSEEDKQPYHDRALEIQIQHQTKYPDYRFAPSHVAPARKRRAHGHEAPDTPENLEHVRSLRMAYLGITGDATPSRNSKKKQVKAQRQLRAATSSSRSISSPSSPQTSPARTPEPSNIPEASLPPFWPQNIPYAYAGLEATTVPQTLLYPTNYAMYPSPELDVAPECRSSLYADWTSCPFSSSMEAPQQGFDLGGVLGGDIGQTYSDFSPIYPAAPLDPNFVFDLEALSMCAPQDYLPFGGVGTIGSPSPLDPVGYEYSWSP